MTAHKTHVSQKKKDVVAELTKKIETTPIIGVVNMQDLPAGSLGMMKKQLRGKADIVMTRKNLMKLALEKAKAKTAGVEKLEEHLSGMPAFIFSQTNPFSIFKTIKKSTTPAPAKPGSIAPSEIVIKAGPTPFTPGPVISELAQLGIKAGVEAGKIAIKVDKVIAKGETISAPMAVMLTKLSILPFEIGLKVTALFEKGTVYTDSVLNIDEKQFLNNITTSAREAINLAVEIAYLTADTREMLVQKAFRDAKAVTMEANILADGIVDELLAKAESQAASVKKEANL